MAQLTRRGFGRMMAVSAGAATVGSQVAAQSTSGATTQGAALYDASLGRYKITALLDGIAPLGRGFFFGPDASVIDAAIAEAGVGPDLLPAPVSAYLLQSEDRTILIDAGMGAIDILGPGFGRIFAGLAAAGVSLGDVDTVVLTHAHPDHLGGLVVDGAAAFPNAELVVAEPEVAFWTDDGVMSQAPSDSQGLFQLARGVFGAYDGKLTQVNTGAEIAPGISLTVSPGHTPGHAILMIDGGDQQLMMVADTMHSADLHTAVPDVGFGFDVDSALAAQSRMKLFDQLATDKMLVAGSHIHFPGFGRVLRSGDTYRFAPATWL